MYSRNKQGVWEVNVPLDAQLDPTRAMLSAGADLMNQLQSLLDEVKAQRAAVEELAQLFDLLTAATPSDTRGSGWIGEVSKERDAG